jgi:tetratricopeptide (TPR) repeat protein
MAVNAVKTFMMRWCRAGIFFALVACSLQLPAATDSVESLTVEARALIDKAHGPGALLEDAAQKLHRALTLDPAHAGAYVQICRLQIVGGPQTGRIFAPMKAETAESAIVRALDLDPRNGYAWVLQAHLHIDAHRLPEAKESLLAAEKFGTDNAWLKLHWAEVYEEQGELELAADNYRAVISGGTPSVRALAYAYSQLLAYYVVKDDWDKADEAYRAGLDAEPGHNRMHADYATALVRHGQFSNAIAPARAALRVRSDEAARRTLARALYGRWAVLLAAGADREAASLLEEARSIMPDLRHVAFDAYREPGSRIIALTLVRQGLVDEAHLLRGPD